MPKKSKAAELVTYLCTRCAWDFSRASTAACQCSLCGKKDRVQEVKREPLTPQALEEGMMRSMDRLMAGLRKAYDARQQHPSAGATTDADDILLLETMVKAKNLEKEVSKMFQRGRKTGGMHTMKISI